MRAKKQLADLEMKADRLITNNVEAYRQASKQHNLAKADEKPGAPNRFFHNKEAAAGAFKMQIDRASGALDALHHLFPDSPAWTETKWIH